MSEVFEAGKDVVDLVKHYIANHHPALASVDTEIAVLFRAKAGKRGGLATLGSSKRAPAILDVLGKDKYKYILEIAADEWALLSNAQQGALVDHLLCACQVTEDDKTGEQKYAIRPPDVSMFFEELQRHGDWRPRPQQEVGGASLDVEEMLGGKNKKKGKAESKAEEEDDDS